MRVKIKLQNNTFPYKTCHLDYTTGSCCVSPVMIMAEGHIMLASVFVSMAVCVKVYISCHIIVWCAFVGANK